MIPVSLRHIAAVRNAGARAARGDVLIFVDADTIVAPATLEGALDALADGAVGGGARVRMDASAPPWVRRVWGIVSLMFWLRLAAGCFMFARRDAFDAVGGYDERMFCAEEIVLSRALGARGAFVIVREPVDHLVAQVRTDLDVARHQADDSDDVQVGGDAPSRLVVRTAARACRACERRARS